MSQYLMSRFPRFGHGSVFANLASSEQEKQTDYVVGILTVPYIIISLFIFWAAVIVALGCMGKQRVGLCAGRMRVDCNEKGRFIHTPAYVWKIRVTFIISGCWMILFCTALVGPGLESIKTTSVSIRKLNRNVNDVVTQGMLILDQSQHVKWNINKLDVQSLLRTCLESKSVMRIIGKFDQLDEVIRKVDFEGIRQQIDVIMDGTDYIDTAVNVVGEYDWIVKMFSLFLGVLTFFLIFAACSAWSDTYQYLTALTCMLGIFILPTFLFVIMCCWIVSSALAFASISNADFCSGNSQQSGPAGTLLTILEERGITSGDMAFDAFVYYQTGCATDNPIIHLYQYEDYLQSSIRLADKFLVKANEIGIDELNDQCGAAVSPIIEGIGIIKENLGILLDALRSTYELASCSKIRPLYTQAFEGIACTEFSGSFALNFSIMFAISLVGMIMVMLRSAMYPIKMLYPPLHLDEEGDELEEYQVYLQYSTGLVMWSSMSPTSATSSESTSQKTDPINDANLCFEVARIEAMVSKMESESLTLCSNDDMPDEEAPHPSAPPVSPSLFYAEDEDNKENMPLSPPDSKIAFDQSRMYTPDPQGDGENECTPMTPHALGLGGMRSRRPVTPSVLTPGVFTRCGRRDKDERPTGDELQKTPLMISPTGQNQRVNYFSTCLTPLKSKHVIMKGTNPKSE